MCIRDRVTTRHKARRCGLRCVISKTQCRLYLHWGPGHPSLENIYRISLLIFPKGKAENKQHLLHRYLQLSQRSTRTAAQPFTISLFCITKTVNRKTVSLMATIRSLVLKNLFHHSQLGAPQKEKIPGALGTCPVCPLVKTAVVCSVIRTWVLPHRS